MGPARTFDHDEIAALLAKDLPHGEIARRIGCTRSLVSQISRRRGYDRRASYEAILRRQALARADRDAEENGPPVPAPYRAAGLSDDYRDLVRDFGPTEGARRCRRLLAETGEAGR